MSDVPSDDLHVAPQTAAGVLGDPMPKGRLLDSPLLAGRIKLRDEDFIVDALARPFASIAR